jgi:hypothetical protein
LIGRRGANPANKINFYANENTPQFTQGVFTTIFNTAMKTRRYASVIRWQGNLFYWQVCGLPSNPWLRA